ncbi:MAG: 50S ribosomal protein L16 [Bdellovibrionales bacterium]|nr:50S ribosomal protein L16 [Bdellovibrionales bacterium]
MLSPKRVKWRRQHRTVFKGAATRGEKLHKGEFGLVATVSGRITSRQIEAARIAMTRYTKRGGDVWIRIFPDRPVTKKAAETRMGSGKGNVEYWAADVKRGRVIYEMAGIPEDQAKEALRLAAHKLPLTCKFISKRILEQAAKAKARAAAV